LGINDYGDDYWAAPAESTPELYPTKKDPHQLVRVKESVYPCYLCARPTDCLFTYMPYDNKNTSWRAHICYHCCYDFDLWQAPEQ